MKIEPHSLCLVIFLTLALNMEAIKASLHCVLQRETNTVIVWYGHMAGGIQSISLLMHILN